MAITEVGNEYGGYEPPEYQVPGSINQSFFDEYKSNSSKEEIGNIKGSIGTLDTSLKNLTKEYSSTRPITNKNIAISEKLSASLDRLTEGTYKLGETFGTAINSIGGFTRSFVETTGNVLTSSGRVVKKVGGGTASVGGTVFGTKTEVAAEGSEAFKSYAGSIKDAIPMKLFGGPIGSQIVGSIAAVSAQVVSSVLKGLFGISVSIFKIGKWIGQKGFDISKWVGEKGLDTGKLLGKLGILSTKGLFKLGKGTFDVGKGIISKGLSTVTGIGGDKRRLVQTSGGSVMASGTGELVDPDKYRPFLKDLKIEMSEAFHTPPKKLSPKAIDKQDLSPLEDEKKYEGFLNSLKVTMTEVFKGYHKGVFGEWGGQSGLRMLVANILPVWGSQYRAELPRMQRYGMMGCMYKLLQMIYVSSRFAAKENNDLLVQIGENQMVAHGLEGTFQRPKPRSLPELLGQKFGGFLKDKFDLDKKIEDVRNWVTEQLPEKMRDSFKPDKEVKLEASPLFMKQIDLLSSIDKRLLFIQNHLSVSKKYLFDIRDFFENISRYQEGSVGPLKKTEIAVVHEGEVVVPKNKVKSAAQEEKQNQEEQPQQGGFFSRMFGGIANFFSGGILKKLKTSLDQMVYFFTGRIPFGADEGVGTAVKPIAERLVEFFKDIYDGIMSEFKQMWELSTTPVAAINKKIKELEMDLKDKEKRGETLEDLKSKGISENDIQNIIDAEKKGNIEAHGKRFALSDIGKKLGIEEDKGLSRLAGMLSYTVELAIDVIRKPLSAFREEVHKIRTQIDEDENFKPEGILQKTLFRLPKSILTLLFGDKSSPYMKASAFKESSMKKVGLLGAVFTILDTVVKMFEIPVQTIRSIVDGWSKFMDDFNSDKSSFITKVKSFFSNVVWEGAIKGLVGSIFSIWMDSFTITSPMWLVEIITKSKIPDMISNVGEAIAKKITNDKKLQDKIAGGFKVAGDAIYDIVMIPWRRFSLVMASLTGELDELKEVGSVFGKRLKTFTEAMRDAKIFDEDDNLLKKSINILTGGIAGIGTAMVGFVQPYLTVLSNIKDNLESTFKEPIDKFKNWINETFSENLIKPFKTVIDYLLFAVDKITNITHKKIAKQPVDVGYNTGVMSSRNIVPEDLGGLSSEGMMKFRAEGSPPGGEPKDSLAMVGEKGAEIINLPKGSYVNNASDTVEIFKSAIDNTKLARSVTNIELMMMDSRFGGILGLLKTGIMLPVKIAGFGVKAIRGIFGIFRKENKKDMEDYMERADTRGSGPLKFIAEKLSELAVGIRDLGSATIKSISKVGSRIGGFISKSFTSLKEYMSGLRESIGNFFAPVRKAISGFFNVLMNPFKRISEWAEKKLASVKDKVKRWVMGEYIVAVDQDNKPVYEKWPGRIIKELKLINKKLAKKDTFTQEEQEMLARQRATGLTEIAETFEEGQEKEKKGRLQRMFGSLADKRDKAKGALDRFKSAREGGKGMIGSALDVMQINPQTIAMIGKALSFTAIIGGTIGAGLIGAGAGNMLGGAIFGEGENQQLLGSVGSVAGAIVGAILGFPLGPVGIPIGVGIGSFIGGLLGKGIGAVGNLGELIGLPDFIVKGGMGALLGALIGGIVTLPAGGFGLPIGAAVGGLIGTAFSAFQSEPDDGSIFGFLKGIGKRFKEGGAISRTMGLLGMIVGLAGGPVLSAFLMNTGLKLGGFIEGAYKEGSEEGGFLGGLSNIWKKVAGWVFDKIPVVGGILKELILGESTEGSERLRMVGQQKGLGGLLAEYISQWMEYVPFVGKWVAGKIRSAAGIESLEEMREKDTKEGGKPQSIRGVIAQFILDKLPGGWLLNRVPGMGWVKKKILEWGGIKDNDPEPLEKETKVKGTINEEFDFAKTSIGQKINKTKEEFLKSDWGKVVKAGQAAYYVTHPEELEKKRAQLAKDNVAMSSDSLANNYIQQERTKQEIERRNMKANFDEFRQQNRQDQMQQETKNRIKERFGKINASQNNMTNVNNVSSNISSPTSTNVYNSVTPYSEGYAML